MKSLLDPCGRYREDLCLRASGALSDQEIADIEDHLAGCARCRKYYDEVESVAGPLVRWERAFAHIEPNKTVQARWAKDFQAAAELAAQPHVALVISFSDWCKNMVWPYRRIWAGLAAIWLVILGINFSTRQMAQSSRLPPEMVKAFLQSGVF